MVPNRNIHKLLIFNNMTAKEFKNVLLFMCNRWNESECSMIFNGFGFLEKNYQYSLGWHIWNK